MARAEIVEQLHQQFHIIVSTRHQVATSEVDPLQAVEPSAETRLDVLQRVAKSLAAALTMAVNVETADAFRQIGGQIGTEQAEARTGRTRIVQRRLNFRIFGVHAQAAIHLLVAAMRGIPFTNARIELRILRERVESDDRRTAEHLIEGGRFVGRSVSVCPTAELFERQAGFVRRGRRGMGDVLAKDGESFPKCEGLESKNELRAASVRDVRDEAKISAQKTLFENVGRRRSSGKGHRRRKEMSHKVKRTSRIGASMARQIRLVVRVC